MMAARMPEEGDDFEKHLGQVAELFHGRFDREELEILLTHHGNDVCDTVNYILSAESKEIRQLLEEAKRKWTIVHKRRRIQTNEPHVLEHAKYGNINVDVRQFACGPCDNYWWRKVPVRKQVSRCKMCRIRKDPVAKDLEYGIAEYQCHNCNRPFKGWGQMTKVWSPCYGCGHPVYPIRILPPEEAREQQQARQQRDDAYGYGRGRGRGRGWGRGYFYQENINQHCCGAPDCFNRHRYRGHVPVGPNLGQGILTCIHPISRVNNGRKKVVIPSNDHISSGSTVDTFLTQDKLNDVANICDLFSTLGSIDEEGWGDDGSLPPS